MANRYPHNVHKHHGIMASVQPAPAVAQRVQTPNMWPVQLQHQYVQQKSSSDDRHQEFLKQQQRLKLMSASSQKQHISADALIENLLEKTDTFKPKKGASTAGAQVPVMAGIAAKQMPTADPGAVSFPAAVPYVASHRTRPLPSNYQKPHWMYPQSPSFPDMYRKVWSLVQRPDGLADTSKIFPILLTSGLSTDVLGYIWGLANRTIPGQLVEEELYTVLALIALAQSGCTFNNLGVLNLIPQPLIPNLNFTSYECASIPVNSTQLETNMKVRTSENLPESIGSFSVPETKAVEDDEFDDFAEFQSAVPTPSLTLQTIPVEHDFVKPVSASVTSSASAATVPSVLEETSETLDCGEDGIKTDLGQKQKFPSVVIVNSSSRGIGSRLANHSLNAPRVNRSRHHRHHHHHRSQPHRDGNSETVTSYKTSLQQLEQEGSIDKMFPKVQLKHSKTCFLRESAIRADDMASSETSRTTNDSLLVNNSIPPASLHGDMSGLDSPKLATVKSDNTRQNELMSVSEDRYSALRDLSLSNTENYIDRPATTSVNNSVPTCDEFGDFMSAEELLQGENIKPALLVSTLDANNKPTILTTQPLNIQNEQTAGFHVDWDAAQFQTPKNVELEKPPEELGKPNSVASDTTSRKHSGQFDLSDLFMGLDISTTKNSADVKQTDYSDFQGFTDPSADHLDGLKLTFSGDARALKVEPSYQQPTLLFSFANNEPQVNSSAGNGVSGDGDDFGDFVGPETWSPEGKKEQSKDLLFEDQFHLGTKDSLLCDSQSVSSLELPAPGLSRHGSLPSLDLKDLSTSVEKTVNPVLELSPQGVEHQVQEWVRCVRSCLDLLKSAAETFGSVTNEEVLSEVLNAAEGRDYLQDLREVASVCHRVQCSSELFSGSVAGRSELDNLLDAAKCVWKSLHPYYVKANIPVSVDRTSLTLSVDSAGGPSCGVCLGYVSSSAPDSMVQLDYGGNVYHAVCANLWVNCVDCSLPSFRSTGSLL